MDRLKITTGRMRSTLSALTLAIVLVLGASSMTTAAGNGIDWRGVVKSAACVQGPTVLLGEIADPAPGVSARTWQAVASTKLWKASSKPGRPITADRAKLYKILKYYLGEKADNLVLPSQLTVQTGGAVVTGEEIHQRVVAFLTPKAQGFGGEVEIKDLKLPTHYFFDNPNDTLSILLSEDIQPGRNQIRLKAVSPEGKVVSSKAGTVFLNIWKAVPVAAKPLNRMEPVTKEKVTFKQINLAYKQELWDGTGGPWRMSRTLGRNQPFTLSHLEPIPLIEKGERINLVYQKKRIQLSIKAEALGEAGMGQQVAVRNLQSNKTIMATVVSHDTVLVR